MTPRNPGVGRTPRIGSSETMIQESTSGTFVHERTAGSKAWRKRWYICGTCGKAIRARMLYQIEQHVKVCEGER